MMKLEKQYQHKSSSKKMQSKERESNLIGKKNIMRMKLYKNQS